MNIHEPVAGASADLNEKMAAARAYHAAQGALMHAIVESDSAKVIAHGIDVVRVGHAMFHGTRPFDTKADASVSLGTINATVKFLELLVEIRKGEKLIMEWLRMEERQGVSEVERYIDRALEVSADPRYDIFIVAGTQADEMAEVLERREYARIVRWADLHVEGDDGVVDPQRTDLSYVKIPELIQCRPQRVWCLWGTDQQCPQSIKESLDARLRKVMINRNTVNTLGASWARQFIQNIPNFARNGRDTMKAAGLLEGSGAIVIGAGPSLDQNIEWIKAQTPRPVIICAYKALKALAKNGITPDFVVMLDPNQQLRHLEGVDLSGVAGFLAEVSVRPDVLAKIDRPLMPYFAGDGTRILSSVFGNVKIPTIPTGGSVFHTGLQLAKLLGCKEITLVGADFGFPEDRLYADGSGSGDQFIVSSDKRSYKRKPLDATGRTGILIGAVANDGSVMATSLELDAYRLWTEEFIRDCQQKADAPRFFNISAKGARIEGAEFVDAAVHRVPPATKSPIEAMSSVSVLVKNLQPESGLSKKLYTKIKKLRSLKRACARATAAARASKASDLSMYGVVVKQAADCPEVSLLLTQQLQELDEQSRRTTVDAPARLLELIEVAETQAGETAELYLVAVRQLVHSSRTALL
jgi:hypothetical protein